MLAEYFKVVGEVAVIAAGVDEVLEGGAADSYRLAHHLAQLSGQLEAAQVTVGSHRFDTQRGAAHPGAGAGGDRPGDRQGGWR